jgi:hypothetical protein
MGIRIFDGSSSSGYTPPVQTGNSGKFLTTDGTSTSWSNTGMVLLGSVTATGTTVSFSNIDQSYRNLQIIGTNLRLGSSEIIQVRANNISGGSYYQVSYINQSSTSVTNTSGSSGAPFANITSSGRNGFILDIFNYSETTQNAKPWRSVSGNANSSSSGQFSGAGVFNSNSATQYSGVENITSLQFTTTNSFDAGLIYIYGVR